MYTQSDADQGSETLFRNLLKQPEDDQFPSDPSEAFSKLEIELPHSDFDTEFSPDDLSWMDEEGDFARMDPSDSVREASAPNGLPTGAKAEKTEPAGESISDQPKPADQSLEGLAGLDLPDWLKAMSPIEARY